MIKYGLFTTIIVKSWTDSRSVCLHNTREAAEVSSHASLRHTTHAKSHPNRLIWSTAVNTLVISNIQFGLRSLGVRYSSIAPAVLTLCVTQTCAATISSSHRASSTTGRPAGCWKCSYMSHAWLTRPQPTTAGSQNNASCTTNSSASRQQPLGCLGNRWHVPAIAAPRSCVRM